MSLDRLRFWFFLLPCLFLYLVTERAFKGFLAVPVIWVAMDLAIHWKRLKEAADFRIVKAFGLYAFIVACSVLAGMFFGDQKILFRDFFLIGSGLALFLFPVKDVNAPLVLFWCFACAYFYGLFRNNMDPSRLLEVFTYNLFLPSTAATENDFGIVFGLFTVHFMLIKSWRWFFPSLMMSLMVSKRALLIGLIMSTAWWILVGRSDRTSTRFKSFTLGALYISLMVFSLFMTELGQEALKVFGVENMNVGRFLMGRNNLIMQLRGQFDWASPTAFFGHGPGSADTFLAYTGTWFGGRISDEPFNPHNDYMKLIFDYGAIGFLLYFAVLSSFYGGSKRGKALMVYTITVFCFDNSLIFMVFHVVAGFMTAYYARTENDAIRFNG